jgi:hypothetical protein
MLQYRLQHWWVIGLGHYPSRLLLQLMSSRYVIRLACFDCRQGWSPSFIFGLGIAPADFRFSLCQVGMSSALHALTADKGGPLRLSLAWALPQQTFALACQVGMSSALHALTADKGGPLRLSLAWALPQQTFALACQVGMSSALHALTADKGGPLRLS